MGKPASAAARLFEKICDKKTCSLDSDWIKTRSICFLKAATQGSDSREGRGDDPDIRSSCEVSKIAW